MKSLYKSLLIVGSLALSALSASAANYIYCTDPATPTFANVWAWQTGGSEGKIYKSFFVNQIRCYWLENNGDNVIFTSEDDNEEMNDGNKTGEYHNIADLTLFANDSGKLVNKGVIAIRADFAGENIWNNYPLSQYDGSRYRTDEIILANTDNQFNVEAVVADKKGLGLGASSGILSLDGDKTQIGGWDKANGKVALPQNSKFILEFDAQSGFVTLISNIEEEEDNTSDEFVLDNINYIMPDFGGNPEPFRTLTAKLNESFYGYEYGARLDKCRMLLSVNQKENVSADALTNQWVKYEDRDPSKETAYHYFYSDDVIEPNDPRYDVMLNSAQFGDQIARRNQWALNKNHNDIHDCRNFNKAWYRGYMVAEDATLEDIRNEVNIDDLYFANHPMAKKNGGRKEIRMSMMGNDENRVARTFFMKDNTSGIEETLDDDLGKFEFDEDSGEVQYYNLQGQRILNPISGQVYIVKRGHEATKEVYIR